MKLLFWLLSGLALAVVAGLVMLHFFLGSVVTKGVNTFGPQLTGTKVTLASAAISPFTGSGTLKGLFVGNPEGWKSDKAFYLGEVTVKVPPATLLSECVQVEEVVIDGPEFVYETKLFTSNLKELLDHVNQKVGNGPASPAPKPVAAKPTTGGRPLKFAVKSFRLVNARATVGVGTAAFTLPLPPLTLTDLGTQEGGITADQLVGKVLPQVLGSIFSEAARSLGKLGAKGGDATVDSVKDAAKQVGAGLKGIFGGKK